jgi:hypothetical protein
MLNSNGTSVIDIVGSEFKVNGSPVGLGPLAASTSAQTLTGKLEAGNDIINSFYIYDASSIVLVPEPGAAMLGWVSFFTLGGLAIVRGRF